MATKQTEPAKVAEEKKSTLADERKEEAATKTTTKQAGSDEQTKRRQKPPRPPAAPSTHPMMTRSKSAMQAAVQQRPVVHLKPPGARSWTWRFMQWFQRTDGSIDHSRSRCRLCYVVIKNYWKTGNAAYHLKSRHHMRPPQRGH